MKKQILKVFIFISVLLAFNNIVYAANKLSLSDSNITLGKGQVYPLTVTSSDNSKITWKTSDKSIITVDKSGKVTAKKNGTAYVTATINKTKLTCKVIVTKVSLSKTSVILLKGKTQTLSIVGLKSKKITWKSSNETVATVNKSGKVTAISKGTAYVMATINGKTYKSKITVEDPSINKTSATFASGETMKLKITGTTQKVTWKSSNTKVATVSSSGKVTGVKKGTTTITATINGVKYKCKVTVCTRRSTLNTKTVPTFKKWYTSIVSDGITFVVPWESSNENVVKVVKENTRYLLIAKSVGKTTLTAVKDDVIYEINVIVEDSGTVVGWQPEKEKEILTLINQKRNTKGIASVSLDYTLDGDVKTQIANEVGFYYLPVYFYKLQEGIGVGFSSVDRTAEQVVSSIPEEYLYDSKVSIIGIGCYFKPTDDSAMSSQFFYSVNFSTSE